MAEMSEKVEYEKNNKVVVVVDDEPGIRDTLADFFEVFDNLKTYRVSNGNEALVLLSKIKADLVISDIRMPHGDGIFLIKSLKDKIAKGLKFVFMTGYSDLTRNEALNLGASEIFYKPFDINGLNDYVLELLNKNGA